MTNLVNAKGNVIASIIPYACLAHVRLTTHKIKKNRRLLDHKALDAIRHAIVEAGRINGMNLVTKSTRSRPSPECQKELFIAYSMTLG